jgi:hypothetical protein
VIEIYRRRGDGVRSGVGFIEKTFVEEYSFDTSYKEYLKDSRTDTSHESVKGNPTARPSSRPSLVTRLLCMSVDRKRPRMEYKVGDDDDDNAGPWAKEDSTSVPARGVLQPNSVPDTALDERPRKEDADVAVALPDNMFIVEPDLEAEKWERVNERKLGMNLMPPRPARGTFAAEGEYLFG